MVVLCSFSDAVHVQANGRTTSVPPPMSPDASSRLARSYDLQERRRTGDVTATELAHYQRMPTDESEAQMLATVDLDGMKSKCVCVVDQSTR